MQSLSSVPQRVAILATGGTIAGTAQSATELVNYQPAQLHIDALLANVPALAGRALEAEQIANIDSKDLDVALWQVLARRVASQLARKEVAGVVVTHGTDTLEETAYLLQRVLAPAKPVVLTGAMRPATALGCDGPQNLLDAVNLASEPGACGVLAMLAGEAHGALDVRKVHTCRVDAFSSGDAGPIARMEAGRLRRLRAWPQGIALGIDLLSATSWPWVEIVFSHAGASGALVDGLVAQGVDGIVVAGTGNGTVHHAVLAALLRAQSAGVAVRRASRVAWGPVIDAPGDATTLPGCGTLSPVQARIELMLELMSRKRATTGAAPPSA